MTPDRPDPRLPRPPRPGAAPGRRDRPGAGLLAPLALAAAVALLAPSLGGDALSDGIARAARCDPELPGSALRWAACIDRQLADLNAHPVAETGLRLHAWRFAGHAADQGVGGAADLRERHRQPIAEALRGNRISLHRLCSAAAAPDCARFAERLERAV